MRRSDSWPSILAPALLLGLVGSARCAAQAPPGASTPRTPSQTLRTPSPTLPSAVSPEIERFVRASGRDVPPPQGPSPFGPGALQEPRPLPTTVPALPLGTEVRPVPGRPGPSDASPLSSTLRLPAAPFAPEDRRFPINLAAALRLSDARPLLVTAAQARVWVAEAELTQAKALWLPGFNLGFDYIRHDGGGPDFNKGVLVPQSVNYFYGGAGFTGVLPLTDAVFEPLVARQMLNARHWDVQAAKNDAVMRTADAYFLVHQYRGTYAATLYSVGRGRELVGRLAALSRDLASGYELDRARNLLADIEQQSVLARQRWREESARLTRVLRLDPRAVVEPLERDHTQVTLIDPGRSLDDLMAVALSNRPEVASRRAMIAASEAAIRREKARPFLPTALLNGFQSAAGMLYQGGVFAVGPNSTLNNFTGRDDVSVQLVWQVESLGFGNLARIKSQRGTQSNRIVDLRDTQDQIAEEVTQAHARLQSAAVRVVQAERSLRTGIITYNGSVEGLEQTNRFRGNVLTLASRPQEAVYALQLLQTAFEEYYGTVAEYNRAQFAMFHALGYPASEVAVVRPPGELVPVDTERPLYLPPVGNGPPPATR